MEIGARLGKMRAVFLLFGVFFIVTLCECCNSCLIGSIFVFLFVSIISVIVSSIDSSKDEHTSMTRRDEKIQFQLKKHEVMILTEGPTIQHFKDDIDKDKGAKMLSVSNGRMGEKFCVCCKTK